jgi:hypothetical protein
MNTSDFTTEMMKLAEYFEFTTQLHDQTMAPILVAKDRDTGEEYEYRLTLTGLKDFTLDGNDLANKALADLKTKARESKIRKLGI